ncbi:50S ribosomal protein L3 glutamine methyltransferase [Betaproteobacteria bacterium]|nr:50S ribosomal protein L3 glutamine methyltransferase [Betaproteobacteria bacterium]GHT91518.1 50S ribosomal protein L3 glutamine methyltransferase [Betaproteobacteria bacterium]GHT98965.1 50S ribosomal protein L3 glutamine methyltransferase [Betaproteobacteria bacterium]GHT99334.1 50S ribosomal protein L3 glutamine methyltransferase [Betaproteobacteria bacterium]GHU14374.1 50S ribosomal protein L3 glutamine methyltransferase [Betaproteobacteria bacterium]
MSHHDHDATCDCGHDHEAEHEHEHESGPLAELVTLRDWLRYAVSRFNRAKIFCGHGVTNTFDEAAWLILATLALPPDHLDPFLDACIPGDERAALLHNIERRVSERIPTAYLVNEAWLGDFHFYVDQRVIVPRSFFAELLDQRLAPWVEQPEALTSALDLCTGSGCLAIVMAEAFPNADIVAADISPAALEVAEQNVTDHALDDRIELVESDLFARLDERLFDLILCNPPYVTAEAMAGLPPEYLHEPQMALAAGEDGLDIVRRLIFDAPRHLYPEGILAVEVGHNRHLVEDAFPHLPFTWLATEGCADGVFLLHRKDLPLQSA